MTCIPRPVPDDFAEMAKVMTRYALSLHYQAGAKAVNRWIKELGISAAPPTYTTPVAKRRTGHMSLTPTGGRGQQHVPERAWGPQDFAANELQRAGWPVHRCDERGRYDDKGAFWRVGTVVCTPDELLERADRAKRKAAA